MTTASGTREVSSYSLPYPFAAVPLEPDDIAFVHTVVGDAEAAHRLFVTRPELVSLCAVFLEHCSPVRPERDALEIMSRFLHVIMYFADRVDPAAVAEQAHEVWLLLLGQRPASGTMSCGIRGAAAQTGSLLTEALRRRGADRTSFAHALRINLSAFVWAAQNPTFRPISLDEHLTFRRESICAIAYLRLWGLLLGLTPSQETAFAFVLAELETLSATVQALANDIRSVDRDRRQQVSNAVVIVEGRNGGNQVDAVRLVREAHDIALEKLIRGLGRARMLPGASEGALAAYLDFIGVCTRGNDTSMLRLMGRYQ